MHKKPSDESQVASQEAEASAGELRRLYFQYTQFQDTHGQTYRYDAKTWDESFNLLVDFVDEYGDEILAEREERDDYYDEEYD